MAEICHLENRHDIIFFCRGLSNLDKISETGAEWHVDCGDVYNSNMADFWANSMASQSHMPHCRVQSPGEINVNSWSCHIVGCKNSIRHIENRFSPCFIFLFLCSLGSDERRLSYTLLCSDRYLGDSDSNRHEILHDGTCRSGTGSLPFWEVPQAIYSGAIDSSDQTWRQADSCLLWPARRWPVNGQTVLIEGCANIVDGTAVFTCQFISKIKIKFNCFSSLYS